MCDRNLVGNRRCQPPITKEIFAHEDCETLRAEMRSPAFLEQAPVRRQKTLCLVDCHRSLLEPRLRRSEQPVKPWQALPLAIPARTITRVNRNTGLYMPSYQVGALGFSTLLSYCAIPTNIGCHASFFLPKVGLCRDTCTCSPSVFEQVANILVAKFRELFVENTHSPEISWR